MAKKVIRRKTAPKPAAKSKAKPKKAPAKKATAPKQRAPRRADEAILRKKYRHIISGSLGFDEAAGKQFVTIKCTKRNCSEERKVYTSDLFQVDLCVEHTLAERKARRAAAAKAKRAA